MQVLIWNYGLTPEQERRFAEHARRVARNVRPEDPQIAALFDHIAWAYGKPEGFEGKLAAVFLPVGRDDEAAFQERARGFVMGIRNGTDDVALRSAWDRLVQTLERDQTEQLREVFEPIGITIGQVEPPGTD
jgi:hypothetical protein